MISDNSFSRLSKVSGCLTRVIHYAFFKKTFINLQIIRSLFFSILVSSLRMAAMFKEFFNFLKPVCEAHILQALTNSGGSQSVFRTQELVFGEKPKCCCQCQTPNWNWKKSPRRRQWSEFGEDPRELQFYSPVFYWQPVRNVC